MKLQPIDDVNYHIALNKGRTKDVQIQWKTGQICLSFNNIFLTGENTVYEIPLGDVSSIDIIENDKTKLLFNLNSIKVCVNSENPARLRALRHFLLPFINERPDAGS